MRSCIRLNDILEDIAEENEKIKFGAMITYSEFEDFDETNLPIIVKYSKGEVVDSVIKLTDELGFNFDYDDVMDFLRSYVLFDI